MTFLELDCLKHQKEDEGTFESYQPSPAVNSKFYGALFSPPLSKKTGRKNSVA